MRHGINRIRTEWANRRESGLAAVATLVLVTAFMVLAIFGLVMLWQTSAQAQELESTASAETSASSEQSLPTEGGDDQASTTDSDSSESDSADEGATGEGATDEDVADEGAADEGEGAEDTDDSNTNDTNNASDTENGEESGESENVDDSSNSVDNTNTSNSEKSSEAAEKPAKKKAHTFKKEIKIAGKGHYTVIVKCDADSEIPQNAELKVVRVMQTPKGYDSGSSKWKGRPADYERFVSEGKMASRIDELCKVFDVQDEDFVYYTEFLDISLVVDGKAVESATPVEVTVETDVIEASMSNGIGMSFYTVKYDGQEHADAIAIDNNTDDSAKNKAYEKGAKFTFTTDELSELGIMGIAAPRHYAEADGVVTTILGPRTSSAWVEEANVDEDTLPAGSSLVAAYNVMADPDYAYGTKLWVKTEGELAFADEAIEGETDNADNPENANDEAVESDVAAEGKGGLACFLLDGDALGEKLLDFGKADQPAAIDAGDAIAVVWSADATGGAKAEADSEGDADEGKVDGGEDAAVEDAEAGADAAGDTADDTDASTEPETTIAADSGDALQAAAILQGAFSASDGGAYFVTVSYGPEANIPEGATLSVRELQGAEREFANQGALRALSADSASYSRAFDITILDAQGNEVEPAAPVEVSITLQNAPVMENPSVVHFAGDAPDVISPNATREKGACTLDFTTDDFSVYVVLDVDRGQTLTTSEAENPALSRAMLSLEGSWATWQVVVNSEAATLNGGENLVLADTFDDGVKGHARQSIDYASINVESSNAVSYDYSGNTGTFVIPDGTTVTITYRTRVTAGSGQAVANATFQGTAVLKKEADGAIITTATATETRTIYPSASDVAGFGTNYMVKLYVYADGRMQTGIAGTKFILLDADKRAMEYKLGDNAGEPVTFVTDENGYANIELSEEDGDVSIEKNTTYYLEMIQAPNGFQKDNTLYNFMITDDPNYNSGGTYTYYNGDTMKVRLYEATPGLRVSLRFSGNYALTQDQQDAVTASLQKYNSSQDDWEDIESHPNSDAERGTITFSTELETGEVYRVAQDNEYPWDLPESVYLTSTYYCLIGSGDSDPKSEPQEFYLTADQIAAGVSVDVVIDNCYEEHELTLTKMDKETGDKLKGAVFTVKKAVDNAEVTSYTTDASGVVVIRGGDSYESETLYYVEETGAPSGYLLPLTSEKTYFYFCNDPDLIPSIIKDLPEGETAVNLSKTFESLTIDNQKAKRTISVMKTWQGNTWPSDVSRVEVGLYQSVDGADPTAVLDENDQPRTVILNKDAPYNNTAFKDLPTRSTDNKNITYSIKEEHVYKTDGTDVIASYVQEYGVSDAGVYIVRNREATSLTVYKEWYDRTNNTKITDSTELAKQPDVTFDVYRTTVKISDDARVGGITYDEMESFLSSVGSWTKVRSDLSFGNANDWTMTISDLAKKDDAGNPYYYYILETVPSFGDELYEVNEGEKTATIKNMVAPETVSLTVQKANLVNDPRPNPEARVFSFTLALNNGDKHPIRNYTVFDDGTKKLTTDPNGETAFTLNPGHGITLTLPVGVTATVTEAYNPEYTAKTESSQTGSGSDDGRTFSYEVTNSSNTITYTNTLHVICKVLTTGDDQPFESLSSALAYIRDHPDDAYKDGVATIQMLEDYTMPASDVFDVHADENIVLTTATTDATASFHFKTSRTEAPTDTAIITRGGTSGSMLTNAGTLTLDKVCLDGDGANIVVTVDGGLVNSSGELNLSANTILRNSAIRGKGGAIFATGTVNMPGGSITGNSATSGSAIYLGGTLSGTLNMSDGSITGNKDASDGAVVVKNLDSRVNLSGNPIVSENTNARGEAANLFIGEDSDFIVNVVDSGLGASARIGVTAMAGHREISEQFASAEYNVTANLSRFTSDIYGYRGKLKEGTGTNIVWDGLTLKVKKEVGEIGASPNDTFAITLSSPKIKMSSYIINGTTDYKVTPARSGRPGTIKLNTVRADDEITISPLPVASYTITEDASNYTPTYEIVNTELGSPAPVAITDGVFLLDGDSTATVTNTRRLADVSLTKTLQDNLVGSDPVNFGFTVKLTETDGTPVKNFPLYENETSPTQSIVTNDDGEATFTMSPTTALSAAKEFKAPVGATMTITEAENSDYSVVVSAKTKPAAGEGTAIEDQEADRDTVFAFSVTDDGADVSFANKRKMAEIELSKKLVGKVSKTESFDFTVTLKNGDGTPAKNYTIHDLDEEWGEVTTDASGQASIQFSFGENEEAETKSILLTIPEGTSLSAREAIVKKDVDGTLKEIYDTTYSIDGGSSKTGVAATINHVTENNTSIAFTNARKMRAVTVTNKVAGYSGNVTPFNFTATVTDGGGEGNDDYDANGFIDGEQTFELATGQKKVLTVPYGATLAVEEEFIIGYETLVKHGSQTAVVTTRDEFQVTGAVTVAFTNNQLINIVLENHTSHDFTNVQVYAEKGTKMYRVNDAGTGQDPVDITNHWATVNVEAGKTAILEVDHQTSQTAEQAYTVKGMTPMVGYYYTIHNEPSYHEFADPAVLRVYDAARYEVKGKLRYSTSDSTITFTEQPLVSFDVNGGAWTTEMEGYHDRDGNRQVYQLAVNSGETVAKPQPDPVYPTAEGIAFLGWTTDKTFAEASHTAGEDISDKAYKFEDETSGVTAPITLYAVWSKSVRDYRVVTVKNGHNADLNVTVTLTNDDPPGAGYPIYEDEVDSSNNIVTDSSGQADFTLGAGESKNLHIPDGAKLDFGLDRESLVASSEFTLTASSDKKSFTIDSVNRDGKVAFIPGVCKITDSTGNVLYDGNGKPAVYQTLAAAFSAYVGALYTDASHTTDATPAAVKMLVDEYAITSKHSFPTKDMVLTTAGKSDADFPYVGVRDRAILYRGASYNNSCMFILESSQRNVTFTNVIVDGGNVAVANSVNGNLIYIDQAGSTFNINAGVTMRNAAYASYSDKDGARGSIYIKAGTLNVSAGLFTNLHARHGGAICVENNAALTITGSDGGICFENCSTSSSSDDSNGGDGGAIYYSSSSKDVTINGGLDKDSPGIIFDGCVAGSIWGDGGAIYATTNKSKDVTITGCAFTECSAKNTTGKNDLGFGGGGIGAQDVAHLAVSKCSFTSCDSMKGGGGILARVKNNIEDASAVSISECSFLNCSCKAQGGAVAAYTDNNKATSSKTKFSLINCNIANCSSGTDNGSGGAIQCYLPRMEFSGSSFTDCWAGKEGGAVNNYFGDSYQQGWANSSMTVDNCRFIRCRAEDRYDPTALQHYGGGINTKAKIATVTNSYFEDCVSTLKEGGALHLGGQDGGSTATITGCTFKNCTAKNGGGALLASTETLVVGGDNASDGCKFYGCSSSASNGGAIYHYRNSRQGSTQKNITVKNCTFSADPDSQDGTSESCSASQDGGAIWTRATTSVLLDNLTIDGCVAGNNGGGVYLDPLTTTATIANGSISNCQAVNGSAVYVGMSATFSGNLNVSENTVSDINDGAIHGGTLYFEGNVHVKDNKCSSDSAYDHDVLMQNDNLTTIQTTSNGLGSDARIGVYVPDENNRYQNYGKEGQKFGTWTAENGNAYLESFFNDRDDELLGGQSSGDNFIYWGIYICKITDANGNTLKRPNGRDAIYQRIDFALAEFTSVTGGEPVYVKMLTEEYTLHQEEKISSFPDADITLTTASKSDANHPYRGTEGTFCTISQKYSNDALFCLDNSNATFRLEGITLDGRKDKTATLGDYRLIYAQSGNVIIQGDTTLQYGKTFNEYGGAVYVDSGAILTVTSEEGKDVSFAHCYQTDNKRHDGGGGAIYSKAALTINGSGTTYFTDCSARRGGAVMVYAGAPGSKDVNLSIANAEFSNCQAMTAGGAIYHDNPHDDASTFISNSTFENCYNTGTVETDVIATERWTYGGAVNTKAGTLTVNASSFKNCHALSSGGAINHGSEIQNRVKTSITDTIFEGCSTTGTNTSYGYGGSVYTQATAVEIIRCEVNGSKSFNYGGALYCDSNIATSHVDIMSTSFGNCSVTRDNGYGGAIYSKSKTLTLDGTTAISACTAPGYSGAVYMETDGSTLNVYGSTAIKGCYAYQGGAIYLKNSVTMNLTGSPEFRENGFTVRDGAVYSAAKGACIYLEEGSNLYFAGSPKFSRNIIPGQERVVNGGILDNVRQDVYLAGYDSLGEATSIHVRGELTGDTIWVWPECDPHRMPNEQFAKTESYVSDATLNMFRNALADSVTGCSNGEYLAGTRVPGQSNENVYWDKMYVISFRKIDNKGVTVPGAKFTLYNDAACTLTRSNATSADGETDTDSQGNVLDKGVVEFISVPIGAYYMKETEAPTSFTGSRATFLVLVGTPWLSPTEYNKALWENGGPLDVPDAATLVARYTTDSGKYYGIFALGEDGKADLSKNLASANTGIENIRTDYEAFFMKVDSSGAALPNAEFTIYTPEAVDAQGNPTTFDNGYPKLVLWSRDGETYPDPVKSADGTTDGPAAVKMLNGDAAPKGLVYFRELPIGTYYLLETAYPVRNGNNKITSYVKTDRVLKLEVRGKDDFALSELLKVDDTYTTYRSCEKTSSNYYAVGNTEAACKLTDGNDNLLYELGGDGMTLLPAVYSTLEEGFAVAQTHSLYDANGAIADVSALKLKALKDFTLTSSINYTSSSRSLTFTTAERTSKTGDTYVFVTNRTSYTSRAEISRAYDEDDGGNGALITVADGASLTLQNISLDGQKATHSGRAAYVESGGSLTIQGSAQLHNFIDTAGSAIYADDGANVTIGGGTITGNVASEADGGAINAGGENARLFFSGAPMVFNNVSSENASEQRNVVLSVDSNEVIRTETGLTGGKIGVYAIDGVSDAIYKAHGLADMPFGTFGHARNLNAFVNDRNLSLYGVRSETDEGDVLIYWCSPRGSHKVVLRKVQGEGDAQTALAGAAFSISRSKGGVPISLDGGIKLEDLSSNTDGVFFVGELAYGDYYLNESAPANQTYFKLTVGETGYTVGEAEKG